jgi:hypothetical protein
VRRIRAEVRRRRKRALFSPDAREALAVYDRWVAREIRTLQFGSALNLRILAARSDFERENHLSAGFERANTLTKLLGRLQKRFPAAWMPLTTILLRRGHFTENLLPAM